jgi:hypothetical protein
LEEIKRLASEGPSAEEMEKLRNNLLNDSVRGRQSTMFRAQMLAEYALYDGDPDLLNTELEHYLRVAPEEIKDAAARFLANDNFSLIEVTPTPDDAETSDAETAAATGDTAQPGAPPPQVPPRPPAQPPAATDETPGTPLTHDEPQVKV